MRRCVHRWRAMYERRMRLFHRPDRLRRSMRDPRVRSRQLRRLRK
jgi:hypothetical protein